MDITSSMSWIFNQFLNIFNFFFDTLDSVKIFGFSLLDFALALIILPIGLNLLVAIGKGADKSAYEYRSRKESRNDKED